MTHHSITPELVKQHGLTPEEYERIKGVLGREPNYTELGIFSVMWSEHCSYKNTRPLLKGFPTKSPRILVGAGLLDGATVGEMSLVNWQHGPCHDAFESPP